MPSKCFACNNYNNDSAVNCVHCGQALANLPSDSAGRWIVGGEPDCDIVVDLPAVSGRHCRLTRSGDGFIIEDLGSKNGTYVNGVKINRAVAVTRKDSVTLGQRVPLPWPQISPAIATELQRNPTVVERAINIPVDNRQVIYIGQDESNDIVLDYPMISSRHARIIIDDGVITLEDLGSTNGTAIGNQHNKIKSSVISAQDNIYLGSFHITASRLLAGKLMLGAQPHVSIPFNKEQLVLGRAPDCDQVLDYPAISWHHARIKRASNQLIVEDLGSTNGTYINGNRVTRPQPVTNGDIIGLGSYTFQLSADGQLEKRDYRGNVTIEAGKVTVNAGNKPLIADISLTIYPSEFVGLMGPSGAGKTTFMLALNGYVSPARGAVLFNGQSLAANYAQFSEQMGYVPQEDIMHRDLTVGQALYYTARLRLPADYRSSEIQRRVKEVLTKLGLEASENVLIGSPEKKGISGGQRKRVNLAMELLTDPSVLFLDEPTSGLSSEDTLLVMELLRQLANTGKSILLTIHQPSLEAYRMMDNLVVLAKDKGSPEAATLAYYGPAYPDAVDFFNPNGVPGARPGVDPSPDEVLRGLAKGRASEWATRYQASRYQREYVEERAGKRGQPIKREQARGGRRFGISQWRTLVQRCLAIKIRDTWNTAILLAQAPIIAILIAVIFGKNASETITLGNFASVSQSMATTVFLLAVSSIWLGCSNAAREIVGEWAIYRRERMVNLKIPSYVLSKFTVLGGFCLAQCAILLGIVYPSCGLKSDPVMLYLILALASFIGLGLGLTVSALSKTSEVAIGLVPLIMIPMVILAGMVQPIKNMNEFGKGLTYVMTSRWAFEGLIVMESRARKPYISESANAQPGTELPDMSEQFFPVGQRQSPDECAIIMSGMLVLLILAITSILKWRDIN